MKEPKGQKLIDRYKKNYSISVDAKVTEEMILAHWKLEKALTRELLESTQENRAEAFQRCYSSLYRELEWLNQLVNTGIQQPASQLYRNWVYLSGPVPKKIYEIGSGKGGLIAHLSACGFDCTATDISAERGQKFVSNHSNLRWKVSDGVHLEQFEVANSYDLVISNHLIEHLHPGDIRQHFKGVFHVLKIGGKYIINTPHAYVGPSDISRVFKCDKPIGLHLKEYTYQELKESLKWAGFKKVSAILAVPPSITRSFKIYFQPMVSNTYFTYLCLVEKLLSLLPHQVLRKKVTMLSIVILFSPSIFLMAEKG